MFSHSIRTLSTQTTSTPPNTKWRLINCLTQISTYRGTSCYDLFVSFHLQERANFMCFSCDAMSSGNVESMQTFLGVTRRSGWERVSAKTSFHLLFPFRETYWCNIRPLSSADCCEIPSLKTRFFSLKDSSFCICELSAFSIKVAHR